MSDHGAADNNFIMQPYNDCRSCSLIAYTYKHTYVHTCINSNIQRQQRSSDIKVNSLNRNKYPRCVREGAILAHTRICIQLTYTYIYIYVIMYVCAIEVFVLTTNLNCFVVSQLSERQQLVVTRTHATYICMYVC